MMIMMMIVVSLRARLDDNSWIVQHCDCGGCSFLAQHCGDCYDCDCDDCCGDGHVGRPTVRQR